MVWRDKKVLVFCSEGNSRSVGCAYVLKSRPHRADALAAGIRRVSPETKKMLCEWAEIIIIMHDELVPHLPEEYLPKMKLWNVGEDIYARGWKNGLTDKVKDFIKNYD